MPVVDASVYIATINSHELAHTRAQTWFSQALSRGDQLFAPSILMAEVTSALSRGVGDLQLAHQVLQQLMTFQDVALEPVTIVLGERAAEIAADHRIRGCDAVYVALAEQLGDYLITLDQEQLQRGAAVITTQQP